MTSLAAIGEEALVARLTALLTARDDVLAGPGDDCAVLAGPAAGTVQVLKTDALVERVHFEEQAPAGKVGWKAIARVLSDFAAMAAVPRHLLVTLALPPDRAVAWVEELYRGMDACAQRFGAVIVGGETSSLPAGAPAVISVSGFGTAEEGCWIGRGDGEPGDVLFVTGRLGGSLRGRHLEFVPRLEEASWLAAHHPVRAMMDLSDGLARDLPRMAEACACGFRLQHEVLPCTEGCSPAEAISDGEDYELLFALDPAHAADLEEGWHARFPDLELTRIGCLQEGAPEELAGGWEHFAGA